MKKLFTFVIVLCVFQVTSNAQRAQHHSYITHYNASLRGPDSVSWLLTPDMVSCDSVKRKDKFAQDPFIANCVRPKEYSASKYDKGHMFPFADAQCDSTDKIECFYMSNMLPQLHSLNAGDWKTLEEQERVWAQTGTIRIIAGGFGTKGKLKSGVNIPESCWKAIYVNHKWRAFVMPNEGASKGHKFDHWEVIDIKRFDAIIGLNL